MADSTDPLSLLAGDDTSSSESEGEEETKDKGLTDKSYYTPTVIPTIVIVEFTKNWFLGHQCREAPTPRLPIHRILSSPQFP